MQLEDIQKKKKLFGQRAEEFVYKFERERLKSNKNLQSKVQIISGLNVAAGFDIVSYEGVNSVLPDRLIEVKAYTEKPAFYWSRNEIEVSKKKGEKYYLYLVENSLISKEDYLPIIIRNPYTHVYKADDWNKNVNTYYVTKGRLA